MNSPDQPKGYDVDEAYSTTRRALHAVAELLVAGPQFRDFGTIRLGVGPYGFRGSRLSIAVEGADVSWPGGRARIEGDCASLAARAGVEAGKPDSYGQGSGFSSTDELIVDEDAAKTLHGVMWLGDQALRSFAPEQSAVLWPEHFDLGITVGEVNYGISPGDAGCEQPYAYVGPWQPDRLAKDDFWNASFGAQRTIETLGSVNAIAAFFGEGQRLAEDS